MAAKRVLITGITGMVGSHLAEYLLEKTDWELFGMCRWRSPLDNLAGVTDRINANDRISLLYADLRDTLSIQTAVAAARPDYVFHLAAQSFPRTRASRRAARYDGHQYPRHGPRPRRIARDKLQRQSCTYARRRRSLAVCPEEKLPINEECSFHPASPYAISKAGTDLSGATYAEAYGMTVMTTRMFTHTGPRRGDVFAESTFAKQIAMIEAQHIPPVVKVGNLQSLRTVADVRDAVRAYYMLVTRSNPLPGPTTTSAAGIPAPSARSSILSCRSRRGNPKSASRSIRTASARSMPISRFRTRRSSKRIQVGSRRFPMSERFATSSTTGEDASIRKANRFLTR